MTGDKGLSRFVSPVIVILALVLIGTTLLFEVTMTSVMKSVLEMSGSSVTLESLDEGAVACFSMFTSDSLMHGIWFGIFGVFCAWGIKRKESFELKLGVLWGVLLIAYGTIAAVSEILYWWVHEPTVCPLYLLSITAGLTSLVCLLVARKHSN